MTRRITTTWKTFLYAAVGRTMCKKRLELQLSQGTVARQLGIGQTTLANIENGSSPVSLAVLVAFAHITDCTIDELIPLVDIQLDSAKEPEGGDVELVT